MSETNYCWGCFLCTLICIGPESNHCALWNKWKRNIGISDRFFDAQMNIFRFSFSISLQNIRKKGRVQFCQIFQKRNWSTDNCEAQCSTLKLKSNFDFFSGMIYTCIRLTLNRRKVSSKNASKWAKIGVFWPKIAVLAIIKKKLDFWINRHSSFQGKKTVSSKFEP